MTNLSCNHVILTAISKDAITITCGVNLRVSAVNSTFFFWRGVLCTGALWVYFPESLHRSSSLSLTKQNTQNWFPWQRGESNLEQLELNTARPVNTHGHARSTSTMAQFLLPHRDAVNVRRLYCIHVSSQRADIKKPRRSKDNRELQEGETL